MKKSLHTQFLKGLKFLEILKKNCVLMAGYLPMLLPSMHEALGLIPNVLILTKTKEQWKTTAEVQDKASPNISESRVFQEAMGSSTDTYSLQRSQDGETIYTLRLSGSLQA